MTFITKLIDEHGGGGGRLKVFPPSKFFSKLVNKNAIKHQKGVPSTKNVHNPSQNLAKALWNNPLDFQTVCIYYKYIQRSFNSSHVRQKSFAALNFGFWFFQLIIFHQLASNILFLLLSCKCFTVAFA